MSLIHNNRGFTLIELFIAIVLFAIGIVATAKLQMAATASNAFSFQVTDALNVAENEIERMRRLSFTASDFNVTEGTTTHDGGTTVSDSGREYNTTWTVANLSTSGVGANSRIVTVRVAWQEKDRPHATTLSFIKGRN
jgi:prepilin-type N-terminal cleavage/methylation domain-containing protein